MSCSFCPVPRIPHRRYLLGNPGGGAPGANPGGAMPNPEVGAPGGAPGIGAPGTGAPGAAAGGAAGEGPPYPAGVMAILEKPDGGTAAGAG